MAEEVPGWLKGILSSADGALRDVSKKLRRGLRLLRLGVALLVLMDIALLAGAVLAIVRPAWLPYIVAVLSVGVLLLLVGMTLLLMLPLRLKSAVRLIDKGYPANARELAIRLAARKMRDQSIETEELLVETAWNESRKAVRKYKDRARRLRDEMEAEEEIGPTQSGAHRPPRPPH